MIIIEPDADRVEEIEPLNSLEIQEESDRDMDTTLWVHQNIIKLSKQFGKQSDEAEKAQQSTIEKKGMNELKGLMFDMNFKSNGGRSKGKGDTNMNQ
ncbi:hypothetical protein H5410_058883 [Solanum commersonii]|uniref:Uncharacterized protein n=1 Tax=Solanum commersonii TaxID=4109 RepID=A0A9J5W0V6_SOLCO|nr:hypothetical protein H5410_058883 [Solanum commersonii]